MSNAITQNAAATEGCAAPAGYVVQVYICGTYRGDYHYQTEAEAQADADRRTKLFSVLGCSYRVRPRQGERLPAELLKI